MMALRFLMGVFEAGFGPGVPYLLSFFYRRHELGLRCGMFLSAAPLANAFAGALAYGITSGHSALANWRLLFLVEGLPTCLAALLAWFCVPDSAVDAKFLTEEEKEVARARSLQQSGAPDRVSKVQWKELAMTLLDVKAWLTAVSRSNIPQTNNCVCSKDSKGC
jgi:MFS family permease